MGHLWVTKDIHVLGPANLSILISPIRSSFHALLFASPTHDSSLIRILFAVPQSCWAVPCVLLFGPSSFIPGFSSPICLTNVYPSFKTHIKYQCNQM